MPPNDTTVMAAPRMLPAVERFITDSDEVLASRGGDRILWSRPSLVRPDGHRILGIFRSDRVMIEDALEHMMNTP